jgi:hypothetical protein
MLTDFSPNGDSQSAMELSATRESQLNTLADGQTGHHGLLQRDIGPNEFTPFPIRRP